jgi:hypothetical protein
MSKVTLAFVFLTALGLGAASAQDKPAAGGGAPAAAPGAPPAAGGGNTVQYKQKTVYDFDDDTVEGDLVRPDGEFIDSKRNAKHSSLIKIRENFIPEMLKSVEGL